MSPRRRILPLFIPHLGCRHDCVFCSQHSVTGRSAPVSAAEVREILSSLTAPVEELALYGGSFTALPRDEMCALLDAARPFVERGTVGTLRVSTRPDAISPEVLALLRAGHVSTVELGAQSMDDGVLRFCGRGHTARDTEEAARAVRDGGFSLILQMMTGLPGSSDLLDTVTAERIIGLQPEGVRIYPTVILRDTPLYRLWKEGRYREHTVEDAVRVCAGLLPLFRAAGIPVLRLGLNPTEDLSAGEAAGGAYHPALGELVRSRIYLEAARALLREQNPGGNVTLGVCPAAISQMTGQHRCNLKTLSAEFGLSGLRVVPAEVPPGTVIRFRNDESI